MGTAERKARIFNQRSTDILAAALTLFESRDWQTVTVEQIAQQAEVSKGTIYKHFVSKDEIYARLAINFELQTLHKIQGLDPALPVVERLRSLIRFAWENQLGSKELHRVYMYCSRDDFRESLPPETVAEMQRINAEINQPVHALMGEGIEQGIFPRKPVPVLLFEVTSALWGATQLVWSGHLGEIDRAQYLEELLNFIFAGLIYQDRRIVATSPSAA